MLTGGGGARSRQHLLALKVCEFLGRPQSKVLVDWACAKVRSARDVDDVKVCELIRNKLHGVTSVSCVAAACASGGVHLSCGARTGVCIFVWAPHVTGAARYADIAATADAAGRRRLATMLLDFEPRAADQVCRCCGRSAACVVSPNAFCTLFYFVRLCCGVYILVGPGVRLRWIALHEACVVHQMHSVIL